VSLMRRLFLLTVFLPVRSQRGLSPAQTLVRGRRTLIDWRNARNRSIPGFASIEVLSSSRRASPVPIWSERPKAGQNLTVLIWNPNGTLDHCQGLTLSMGHVINARFALGRYDRDRFPGRTMVRFILPAQTPTRPSFITPTKVLRWKRVRNSGSS
jgi:hypothetical protein